MNNNELTDLLDLDGERMVIDESLGLWVKFEAKQVPLSKQAGTASSLYTMLQILISFITTSILSVSHYDNSFVLALTFILTSGLAYLAFNWLDSSKSR